MSVFDKDFDMREYIASRMLEMQNLESRQLFKEITGRLFQELYNEAEERFDELEERVISEVPLPVIGPDIITGIVSKEKYDITDSFMYPLRPADLAHDEYDLKDMSKALKNGNGFPVRQIFLAADVETVRKFAEENRLFRGIIRTNHGQTAAEFRVEAENWYAEQVQRLCPIFRQNYFNWRTVCMPYFHKIFRVLLVNADGLDEEDELEAVTVDFDGFSEVVRENQLPIWNISCMDIKTSTYPEPCIDKINYEHRIFKHRFPEQQRFLLAPDEGVFIDNIRWENGDLLVTTPLDEPVVWKMYVFNQNSLKREYENPLMSNAVKDTFAGRLRGQYPVRVRTKTEINRIITGLETATLDLVNVRICANNFLKETYRPDDFIADEIRTGSWQQAMLFEFKRRGEPSYLDTDIMSFITGVLQEIFPEYECCGHLL